jgi:multicomponent Na+:H+ antiporter subunit A
MALLFAIYSAPDLALTQIMVESLIVVLLVLLLRRLPTIRKLGGPGARAGRSALALAGGVLMAFVTLAASSVTLPGDASSFFAEASWPLAKGRNVVNVILVDFRALDTFGEIAVVAGAAIGVVALLRGLRRNRDTQ